MADITTTDVNKIDNEAVLGLLGVHNSLAYKVHEIETHFHGWERWVGPAASPSAAHIADPLGEVGGTPAGVITSFQVTSGANKTWGTALQVFGATDAAVCLPTGYQASFDPHHIKFTDVQTDKQEWLLRIIYSASTAAAGVTAETYTVKPFFIEKTNKNDADTELMVKRAAAGTLIWVQALQLTNNDARTLDIQFGLHGYGG